MPTANVRGNPPTRKTYNLSLKLCISLLYTLGTLLFAFFNVWSIYLAPILNNWVQMSSSVAQNNGTFMYWKCSGKRSVLTTYCCIHFHPSQCVLLIVKWLIQILLIIGGVSNDIYILFVLKSLITDALGIVLDF